MSSYAKAMNACAGRLPVASLVLRTKTLAWPAIAAEATKLQCLAPERVLQAMVGWGSGVGVVVLHFFACTEDGSKGRVQEEWKMSSVS